MEVIRNHLGGINEVNNSALERAQAADLVTLPQSVKGTNCFNCKFIRDIEDKKGYCSHKKVLQYVNGRMCCALWSSTGMYAPFKRSEKFT